MIHLILISYNYFKQASALINHLRESVKSDVMIHFVDNRGISEIRADLKPVSNFKYYHWGNLGYGLAFNEVIKTIQLNERDLFFISNDDIQLEPDTIDSFLTGYNSLKSKVENLGILSPNYQSTNQTDSNRYNVLESSVVNKWNAFTFAPGAFWMFDYTFLKEVGGFLPNLFLYAEDRELCDRAKSVGFTNFYINEAIVYHNFIYPPKTIRLRVLKEKNTMVASFLNTNQNRSSVMMFVIKGCAYNLTRLKLLNLISICLGFLLFFKQLRTWKRIKDSHRKHVIFRYL